MVGRPACAWCVHGRWEPAEIGSGGGLIRCRHWAGAQIKGHLVFQLAAGCQHYEREPGADDEVPAWVEAAR